MLIAYIKSCNMWLCDSGMALMWSLRQTLSSIGSHLPQGFDPSHGIKSLFPPGYVGSISVLSKYVYFRSGRAKTSSNPDDYASYCVGADGAGKWFFSWIGFAYDLVGVDIPDAGIRVQAGFVFHFSSDGSGRGYVDNSRPKYYERSCNSGTDAWIHNNWPKIFASDVYCGYQEAAGFSDLPPDSNIWVSAGFPQAGFIGLSGGNISCARQGSGSSLFPFPALATDLYVTAITASAESQAIKNNNPIAIGVDTVKQVLASPSFSSSAAASISAYITTPAALQTISDAKIIAGQTAKILNPQLSPFAPGQVTELSSQLTANQVLTAVTAASSAFASPSSTVATTLSELRGTLGQVSDVVDKAMDGAYEAVQRSLVNSGGNYWEIPFDLFFDLAVWLASNTFVDDTETVFEPNAGPDPGDAGVPGGTPDPSP